MRDPLLLTVVGIYLLLILSVGFVFRRLNSSSDAFFRSGCQGTWWMVGMSIFMGGFSAWTFTGGAALGYEAGWTVAVLYFANVTGSALACFFFAQRFRQLRITAMTEPDRLRFGEAYAQFTSVLSVISGPLYTALHLYGLAVFMTAIFKLDFVWVLVATGLVGVTCAAVGGNWAVMAIDYLMGIILVAFTALVGIVCWHEIGGLGGMLARIDAAGLTEAFRPIKPRPFFSGEAHGWWWAVALVVNNAINYLTMGNAVRFAAVKDGREARLATLFAALLFFGGMLVWTVPPIAARLLFPSEVQAAPLAHPADAAYAVASMKLLPSVLTGVLVAVMFSVTLSGMDLGLNRRAAVVVRVVHPAFARWAGRPPMDDRQEVAFGRVLTVLFGLISIALALLFAQQHEKNLFDLMLAVLAFFGGTNVPSLLGLFVQRTPGWAPFATVGAAMIGGILGWQSKALFGAEWSFPFKVFSSLGVGTIVFLGSTFFYRADPVLESREKEFFARMNTPVDFAREVGRGSDARQLSVLGFYALVTGVLLAPLAFVAGSERNERIVLALASGIALIGLGMVWAARRARARGET